MAKHKAAKKKAPAKKGRIMPGFMKGKKPIFKRGRKPSHQM